VSSGLKNGIMPVVNIKEIADLLAQIPEVTRHNTPDEDEAWTLAHGLSDLEESFRVVLDDLLVKLMNKDINAAERFDILLDIGEELRHIMYHIKDSRFYKYLDDSEG
jgi:hypothetical protein